MSEDARRRNRYLREYEIFLSEILKIYIVTQSHMIGIKMKMSEELQRKNQGDKRHSDRKVMKS